MLSHRFSRSARGSTSRSSLGTSDLASASRSSARRARRTTGASVASRSSMTSMACNPCGPRSISFRRSASTSNRVRAASICSRRPAAGRSSSRNALSRSRISVALGRPPASGPPQHLAILIELRHDLASRQQKVERRPAEHAVLDALPGARVQAQCLVLGHRVQVREYGTREPADPCDGTIRQIMRLAVYLYGPQGTRRETTSDAHGAPIAQASEQRAARKAPVPRTIGMVHCRGGREAEQRGRQEFEQRRLTRLVVTGDHHHALIGQAVLRPVRSAGQRPRSPSRQAS